MAARARVRAQVENIGDKEGKAVFIEPYPNCKPCGDVAGYISPFAVSGSRLRGPRRTRPPRDAPRDAPCDAPFDAPCDAPCDAPFDAPCDRCVTAV